MSSPELISLARAHMAQQVRDVAVLQTAAASAYDRYMSVSDLDGSFTRFYAYADAVMGAGRSKGAQTAYRYYSASRQLAGVTGRAVPQFAPPSLNRKRSHTALRVTGPVFTKSQIARGVPADTALSAAKVATLGAFKRLVLEAPRRQLISLSQADSQASGWARVSDGRPCSFCAMLVSRGPVYSESGGDFEAHDKCGCSVELVYKGQDGWSDDARQYRSLWEDNADPASFRSALSKQRAA